MNNFKNIVLWILIIMILSAASLYALSTQKQSELPQDAGRQIATAAQAFVVKETPVNINDLPLVDSRAIYQQDNPTSVVVMYLTVRKGNPGDKTDNTWEEVNSASKFFFSENRFIEVPKVEAIFQVGDESGPLPGELGYGAQVTNSTVQIRGNSASMRTQKSYRISLNDSTPGWRGQYTIALNKHVGDPTRVKNKLNFDLLKEVPNLTSLRSQFVHLYVKDETTDPPGTAFVDYGLYTQLEQPNRTFLRSHGLDPNAQLYKASYFEFYRYPEDIKMADDPTYSVQGFESRLEIKGKNDHRKLIQLLDDINNPAIPIETTFTKYFNADNYFTWMAYNILMGSTDTEAQNFFLYSPENSQRWYFLPWDYDDSLARLTKEAEGEFEFQYWEEGIATYWGSLLHRRVLSVANYRNQLDQKVEYLRTILTETKMRDTLEAYIAVAEPYFDRMPDQYYHDTEAFIIARQVLPKEIENNYRLYKNTLRTPMPFFLGKPEIDQNSVTFVWSDSYEFNAENISYTVQVSRDFNFTDLIYTTTTTNIPKVIAEIKLEPGDYFWRVLATNQSGYTQYPFDRYIDTLGLPHNGMARFTVSQTGEVLTE